MRKLILAFFFIPILFSVGPAVAWEIDDFSVRVDVNADATIDVTESIRADFTGENKHGIIRNIPVSYQDESGKARKVSFELAGITDENGDEWQYQKTVSGGMLRLKIGSPDVTYSSPKKFVIKYRVAGALLFMDDHDQLYWNATGTEWDAPIRHAEVLVSLPALVERESIKVASYSGRAGSRTTNVQYQVLDGQNISFVGGNYRAYEGLTIVVGWPKGIVEYDPAAARGMADARQGFNWAKVFLLLPIFVFLGMFRVWKRIGRDPRILKSVVVEYQAPENLKPAEIGMLMDHRVDMRDISATIVDLAVRGYLKIVSEEGMFWQRKYSFMKLKEADSEDLAPYEKKILFGIFGSKAVGQSAALDDLENAFYKNLEPIHKEVFGELRRKGLYLHNPQTVTIGWIVLAVFIFFFSFFAGVISPYLFVGMVLSALIVLVFGLVMPARTLKGAQTYSKILGFEEFLQRTEKDKLRFEEQIHIFERMLPYAVCLGLASKWTKAFAGLYQQPPHWYGGSFRDGFTMDHFARDLNNSLSRMNSTLVSAPRTVSSGGGFSSGGSSGGGFGGGGGSSW